VNQKHDASRIDAGERHNPFFQKSERRPSHRGQALRGDNAKRRKGAATMSKKDLKKAVYRLRELEAQAGEIAQKIDMLKDAIKAEMTAQNVTEMQVDVFRIRWASVQSCRFDSAAFKRAMPDLYGSFLRQTETRRFSVQ
jgi:hypothetical protein